MKVLPEYEPDEGPLTGAQLGQIKKQTPQGKKRSVRTSLFEARPRYSVAELLAGMEPGDMPTTKGWSDAPPVGLED